MEWTNELTFEFLNLYQNEEALWKSSSPQHKNKNDMHDAWLRIKNNLKDGTIPIMELKKKKENLMSTYRKIKGKIKNSMTTGSGTEDIYKSEWPFYNIMSKFLDDIYKPRTTKSTIVISDESEEDSRDENNELNQNLESNEDQDIAFKTPKIIPPKKRKLDETQNRMDEAYSYLKQLSQKPQKDVSSLYCDLLAEKLRSLKERTREIAMLEIDKLVFNLKQVETNQQPIMYNADYHGATAISHMRSLDHSTYHSQSPSYTVHTPFNRQQSPIAQSPQGSPNLPPPSPSLPSTSSHSLGYQSPHHSQPSPHTHSFHSQPPRPQTPFNPQSPQGSPNLPPPSPSPPSTSSHSLGYQSPHHSQPSPHTHSFHSQPPRPQTPFNPQSPQGSPNLPPPSPSPPSTSSHSLDYQSTHHSQPSPHTHSFHSQPPRPQTDNVNLQQPASVSVLPGYQDPESLSLKDFYECQKEDIF